MTLADSGTSTTVNGDTPARAAVVPLNATAGLSDGDVIAIGAGATREFHVIRSIVSELSIATTPTTAIHAQGVTILRQLPLMQVNARSQDNGQTGCKFVYVSHLCVTLR